MRKADRLFQIIQILRRSTRPVTAAQLAEELEVGKRTVYRDIADLVSQRVPIDGEAGLGYLLDPQYEMPPLMLTPEEIDTILLGAQMVARLGDVALTNAAADVIAKISSVVPKHLLPYITEPAVGAKPADGTDRRSLDTRPIRSAIREGRKLRLHYCSATDEITQRVVWPVILGYADTYCLLIAWCELRRQFRHFRTDRIVDLEVLADRIGERRAQLRKRWQLAADAERSSRHQSD